MSGNSGNPEAVVFVLDVGPKVWQRGSLDGLSGRNVTMLDKALLAITRVVHQKIIEGRKRDRLRVVLFNTDRTDNHLTEDNDDGGSTPFAHICTLDKDFSDPSAGFLRALRPQLELGKDEKTDVLNALIVGADLLLQMGESDEGKAKRPKRTANVLTEKRVVLLSSRPKEDTDLSGIEDIASQLESAGIALELVALEDGDRDAFGLLEVLARELKTQRLFGIDAYMHPSRLQRRKKMRQVATFKGDLRLSGTGSILSLPIHMYLKTSEQRLPSAKKVSASGAALTRDLFYVPVPAGWDTEGPGQKEPGEGAGAKPAHTVDKKHLIKAYRYGKSLVPLHRTDQEQLLSDAAFSVPGLDFLGFLPMERLEREALLSNVHIVVAEPGNEQSARGLGALARALAAQNMAAVARFVKNAAAGPRLVALWPGNAADANDSERPDSLMLAALPFAEDLRRFLFASFPCRVKLSAEQRQAMKEFVETLSLNESTQFQPENTFNLGLQYWQMAVAERAINPDAPLLPPSKELKAALEQPAALKEQTELLLGRLKTLFPLERKVTQLLEARDIARLWQASVFGESVAKKDNDADVSEDGPAKHVVRSLDPENPLPSFQDMITNEREDLVVEALTQLMALIPRYVQHGQLDLAFECFSELRRAALMEDEFAMFNIFLREYKRQAALHSPELWQRLRAADLTLISVTENAESVVTPEEASQFLEMSLVVD